MIRLTQKYTMNSKTDMKIKRGRMPSEAAKNPPETGPTTLPSIKPLRVIPRIPPWRSWETFKEVKV
jgi:hypothetical protein